MPCTGRALGLLAPGWNTGSAVSMGRCSPRSTSPIPRTRWPSS